MNWAPLRDQLRDALAFPGIPLRQLVKVVQKMCPTERWALGLAGGRFKVLDCAMVRESFSDPGTANRFISRFRGKVISLPALSRLRHLIRRRELVRDGERRGKANAKAWASRQIKIENIPN